MQIVNLECLGDIVAVEELAEKQKQPALCRCVLGVKIEGEPNPAVDVLCKFKNC